MFPWYRSRVLRQFIKFDVWSIAIREHKGDYLYASDSLITPEYKSICNTDDFWFADPIIYESSGCTYLFVEAYSIHRKKGEIGVFNVENGGVEDFRILIANDYHMSFPLVFEMCGEKFMIPESGDNEAVPLYRSQSFPDKWVFEKNLIQGERYRDSTIYKTDNDYFIHTFVRTDNSKLFHAYKYMIFRLNEMTFDAELVYESEDNWVNKRSAGPVLFDNGHRIHVTQKCDKCYGEALEFWKCKVANPVLEGKEPYKTVFGKDVVVQNVGSPAILHTYSRTSRYEAIDYKVRRR